jgi:hypothetical protein
MILNVHVPGAHPYDVGDEIWQEPLEDAIRAEAETIAGYAGSELLESPDQSHRDALQDRVIAEMTRALVGVGDTYRAPDGVLYSLTDRDGDGRAKATDTPSASPSPGRAVIIPAMAPTVVAVLRFESLPVDERGSAASRGSLERRLDRRSPSLVRSPDHRGGSWELSAYVLPG